MRILWIIVYISLPINIFCMTLKPQVTKIPVFQQKHTDQKNNFSIYKARPMRSIAENNSTLYLQPYIYINNITRATKLQITLSYFPNVTTSDTNTVNFKSFKISSGIDFLTFPIIFDKTKDKITTTTQTNSEHDPITGYIFLFPEAVNSVYKLITNPTHNYPAGYHSSKYHLIINDIPNHTGSLTIFLKENYNMFNERNFKTKIDNSLYNNKFQNTKFSLESHDKTILNLSISEDDIDLFNSILYFYLKSVF